MAECHHLCSDYWKPYMILGLSSVYHIFLHEVLTVQVPIVIKTHN